MAEPAPTPAPIEPPASLVGALGYVGPGLLVAATVVGSGELIATTKTGAQAGIIFLWLIILGCFIKVFVQVELGRYTLSAGEPTLQALDRIPGPRFRAGWVIWLWLAIAPAAFAIMGGVLGGVGQVMAMMLPITGDYIAALAKPDVISGSSFDDRFWGTTIAVATSALLYFGRYRLIERVAVGLVMLFTLITIGNVFLLEFSAYRLSAGDIVQGLSFGVPDRPDAWFTVLATFGIIGVGAIDLISYSYWCLEKGYARYCGPRDDSAAWVDRARGWVRVMKVDTFVAMAVYTTATVAFYLIGAAVLHRDDLDPDGMHMISTLIAAYVPIFGPYARWLLLIGALAVLYSSFLIGSAAAARLFADGFTVLGFVDGHDPEVRQRTVDRLSLALPLVALAFFLSGWNPVLLILIGGIAQTVLLPVVGFGAIYLRFKLTDPRLAPGLAWDAALILSCVGFVVVAGFGLYWIFRTVPG
jgi:Mn2+/Fe2+ NRAMP family transporter